MKTKGMDSVLENFSRAMFGRSRKDPVCIICGTTKVCPWHFRDALSRKEFGISRMCQVCQDKIWNEETYD